MKNRWLVFVFVSSLLSGCGLMYRPDIVQGTIFTPEQVAQIVTGMPKETVYQILGAPTVTDPFHGELEQYNFFYKSGKTQQSYQRSLTIYYDVNNKVLRKEETPVSIREN